MKFNYNRPQILNRLNLCHSSLNQSQQVGPVIIKKDYNKLYEQYEQNIDFWSIENLRNNLQQSLLNQLISYWWPKFLIRLNSFNSYIELTYPSYNTQKRLLNSHNYTMNDLNAKNIERTIQKAEKLNKPAANFNSPSVPQLSGIISNSKIKSNSKKKDVRLALSATKTRQTMGMTKQINTNNSNNVVSNKDGSNSGMFYSTAQLEPPKAGKQNKIIAGLEAYDLDEYKTSPPIGWKRPASTTSIMIKKMMDAKKQHGATNDSTPKQRNKFDKDIYLEAIYREDVGGQIFMN